MWNALHSWYGGGPAVRRIVCPVPDAKTESDVRVALYPELAIDGKLLSGAGRASDSDSDSDATEELSDDGSDAAVLTGAGNPSGRVRGNLPFPISTGESTVCVMSKRRLAWDLL